MTYDEQEFLFGQFGAILEKLDKLIDEVKQLNDKVWRE